MLELILKKNEKIFTRLPISETPIAIGRSQDNHVRLIESEISRHHCRLEWIDGALHIIDLSSNGTLINGKISKKSAANIGDKISIGPWTLVIGERCNFESPKTIASDGCQTKVIELKEDEKRQVTGTIELTIQTPDGKISHRKISSDEITFGQHKSCGIAIPDPYASRNHCKIINSGGNLNLVDLASTNGTYIGDTRVTKISIPPSGAFCIGQTKVSYKLIHASEKIRHKKTNQFGGFVGKSRSIRKIFSLIERVAPTEIPVCITGASGTGKELAARELHNLSLRRRGPFVAINCGAIPASIIESHLFGHERGAFTGATERMMGLFEQAKGGTLFLDEIGEMPQDLQTRLLRVLETQTVRRIGGQEEIPIDIRVISATNRDLKQLVTEGKFREDLFFRLFVAPIAMPPLKERTDDIHLLAEHFLKEMAKSNRSYSLTDAAKIKLEKHSWPGNVRELKNTLKRSTAFAEKEVIDTDDLKIESFEFDYKKSGELREKEISLISRTIRECAGNLSKASKKLGIARTTLQKKMKKYAITHPYCLNSDV